MAPHFVLFEHAAGYGLFRLAEFEEVATFLPEVEASVADVSKFSQVVNLIGFFPFKTAENALENINAISEGIVTPDLKLFLETNLPKAGKKGAVLGVSDSKLSASIGDELGVKCSHIGVIPEVIRGIRFHFAKLVKGFTAASSDKAQLGLSHAYSRSKVKFNVHKSDNMIIQSIALLDQLDKDINTFSMRIREWYSYHFPELIKIVPETALFAKCVKLINNRKELTEEKLEGLEEIVMDSAKAQAILDASKMSMGCRSKPCCSHRGHCRGKAHLSHRVGRHLDNSRRGLCGKCSVPATPEVYHYHVSNEVDREEAVRAGRVGFWPKMKI